MMSSLRVSVWKIIMGVWGLVARNDAMVGLRVMGWLKGLEAGNYPDWALGLFIQGA